MSVRSPSKLFVVMFERFRVKDAFRGNKLEEFEVSM